MYARVPVCTIDFILKKKKEIYIEFDKRFDCLYIIRKDNYVIRHPRYAHMRVMPQLLSHCRRRTHTYPRETPRVFAPIRLYIRIYPLSKAHTSHPFGNNETRRDIREQEV